MSFNAQFTSLKATESESGKNIAAEVIINLMSLLAL